MTLAGSDISVFQTKTPSLAGQAFVIVRATDGTLVDPMFAAHYANARKAGVVVMAYAFGYDGAVGASPAAQAAALVATAAKADYLFLDQERSSAPMTNADAAAFVAAVHAAGRQVGLYHSLSGYPTVGQDVNWVADWNPGPPPIPWTVWQHAGGSSVAGDLDEFNGDQTALEALIGGDVHYISSAGLGVSSGYVIDVPAGTVVLGFDGVQITKLTVATALPFVGRVDGSSSRVVVRLTTGAYPAGDILAEVVTTAQPRPVPAPPDSTPYSQADVDAAKLLGEQGQYDLDARSIAVTPATAKLSNPRPR